MSKNKANERKKKRLILAASNIEDFRVENAPSKDCYSDDWISILRPQKLISKIGDNYYSGTFFSVSYQGEAYLVTCAHNIKGASGVWLNKIWINQPEKSILKLWQSHEDEKVDIAVAWYPAWAGYFDSYDLEEPIVGITGGYAQKDNGNLHSAAGVVSVCSRELVISGVNYWIDLVFEANTDGWPGTSGSPILVHGTDKLIGMIIGGDSSDTALGVGSQRIFEAIEQVKGVMDKKLAKAMEEKKE